MSRKIDLSDPSRLSAEDVLYLQERGQLASLGLDATPVEAPSAPAIADVPNTGDVNTPKPVPASPPPEGNGDADYASLTKVQLADIAESRGLNRGGTKSDLIERLTADDSGITEE